AATKAAEAEIAGEEAPAVVEQAIETPTYTATSKVDNSGFQRTVGLEGAWKFDMNVGERSIILTGGTLSNKGEATSDDLQLMVYLADKPFDVNNPQFIGEVYSVLELSPIAAGNSESGKTYTTTWASQTDPSSGTYYPYILLGEKNAETQEFEVKDVKVFENSVTLP